MIRKCINCSKVISPHETYPYGQCSVTKKSITLTVPLSCDIGDYEKKGSKSNGKN